MRAAFLFEGNPGQLDFVSTCLRRGLQSLEWPHVMAYDMGFFQRRRVRRAVDAVREACWPNARALLADPGPLPAEASRKLQVATRHLSDTIGEILGPERTARLSEPVEAYFACGSLPIEWLLIDGVPLCLHSPVYRFARPQDVLSPNLPPPEVGPNLIVAPTYEGKTSAVASGSTSTTLLEGKVEARQLEDFADGQFARLVFHGRAKGASLLGSDGEAVPLAKLLRCVRGAAYVIGTSTGDFHAGALEAAMKAIPQGLHGALLAAFPLPGAYADRIAQIVLANFARPGGLRIQDVAHMARLSLAWIAVQQGIARLAGHTDVDTEAATPFEADYAAYSRWGAGVEALRAQVADLPAEARNALLSVVTGFAMAVESCGTPMFLLPDAHPLLRRFFKAFATWDGGATPR